MIDNNLILLSFLFILNNVIGISTCHQKNFTSPFVLPIHLELTPFQPVNATLVLDIKCTFGSAIERLTVNLQFPRNLTCNGIDFRAQPGGFTTIINGKQEQIIFDSIESDFMFLNGNIMEYDLGRISSGSCVGDQFSALTFYAADDQFGCNSGSGLNKIRVQYGSFDISGPKCKSSCYLAAGKILLSPPITNDG